MEIDQNVNEQPAAPNTSKDWPFSYFTFDYTRDTPDGVRSAILVVAALVATASFQAMMSPPEVITKRADPDRFEVIFFICSTTLAWSASMTTIEWLTASFPFQREIRMSYIAMGSAFGLTANAVGRTTLGDVPHVPFLVCVLLPWASRSVPMVIKRVWNCVFRCN